MFKNCTVESLFCGTTGMSSTLSKNVRLGLLEHEQHDHRDVHSPLASICIPPWPGGVSRWRGPLGVGGATPPPVDPRRPTELTPNVLVRTHQLVLHARHRNVSTGRRRHVHQLFRQLRITYQASRRDVLEDDLGHFNNLLGNRHKRIDEPEHFHQLVHRLRHGSIEQRDLRHAVDNLLHGAPLHPLLRPRHVKQTVWPGATGGRHLIHVHWIVHSASRLVRGMPPDLRRKVQLEMPLPGPGLLLSPCC